MHDKHGALRVGLIGAGKMGRHHLKAIASSGIGSVVGIADPAASHEELRPLIPADAIVVGSMTELLAQARPDVVHIVTPPSTHEPLALHAIGAGCHVYVEKPFAPTVAAARRILAAADEHGVRVCAGHQVLFEGPALGVIRHLPEIGRLVHVESFFSFKMVRRTITEVEQVNDILPHAVYPVVEQLRAASGSASSGIEVVGVLADAAGEVYALLRLGRATAIVTVTLNGRPVEQYQTLIGTNGSLRADYIGGFLDRLIGPGTGPGVLLTPYRRSLHTLTGATRGTAPLITGRSYPGLRALVRAFYEAIESGAGSPTSPQSIVDTVSVCETLAGHLAEAEAERERAAATQLDERSAALPPTRPAAVLVTGGTGLLGRKIAEELRQAGFRVRVLARRIPPHSRRAPGVEYVAGDLAAGINPAYMQSIDYVVHAAAETSGGQEDHRRNSVDATRNVVEAARTARVKGLLHISSLAVLKTSREMGHPLDELTPVDSGSLGRGPYVWGKAESERVAQELSTQYGVPLRVIRPGPLVDFGAYAPPGRLGREIGPIFVAIGPKRAPLSVCDVGTAARVVRSFLEDFAAAPAILNLVEAPPPSRRELMGRYLQQRPDLRVLWVPSWVLRALAGPAKLLQRLAFGAAQPIDVAAAFASERYRTDLAAAVVAKAGANRS